MKKFGTGFLLPLIEAVEERLRMGVLKETLVKVEEFEEEIGLVKTFSLRDLTLEVEFIPETRGKDSEELGEWFGLVLAEVLVSESLLNALRVGSRKFL